MVPTTAAAKYNIIFTPAQNSTDIFVFNIPTPVVAGPQTTRGSSDILCIIHLAAAHLLSLLKKVTDVASCLFSVRVINSRSYS